MLAVVECFLDGVSVAIDAAESFRLSQGESCGGVQRFIQMWIKKDVQFYNVDV